MLKAGSLYLYSIWQKGKKMDKTLLKGLMVLEVLSQIDGEAKTIDEIMPLVNLTRSNTHRTLQTLTHAGYVKKDTKTGSYKCTLKMFELGARQLAKLDVKKIAPTFMRELAHLTGETVHLSVLEKLEVVYIDKIDSAQPLQAYSRIGGRAPAYAVATGKALLAFQSPTYLDMYSEEIHKFTKNTNTSIRIIKEDLANIARVGYAINRGEWRQGIGGVAAPIFNALNNTVAAIGISGPLERLSHEKMIKHARHIQKHAHQISIHLGYKGIYFGAELM